MAVYSLPWAAGVTAGGVGQVTDGRPLPPAVSWSQWGFHHTKVYVTIFILMLVFSWTSGGGYGAGARQYGIMKKY